MLSFALIHLLSFSLRRSVARWTPSSRSCCLVILLKKHQVWMLLPPLPPHPLLPYLPSLLGLRWRKLSACAAEVSSKPKTNRTDEESGRIHHKYEYIFPEVQYGSLYALLTQVYQKICGVKHKQSLNQWPIMIWFLCESLILLLVVFVF